MALPLHMACITGKKNYVKKVIESMPVTSLEVKDEAGKTALILSINNNQLECAGLLLKAGVHVDNSDNTGQTALHKAANKGHHRAIKLLLTSNASCRQKDFFGVTPLHLAAVNENPKCLAALLKDLKPGEVDVQDSSKKTALHWAAAYSNIENIKLLLLKGANISIPDEDGKIPLHWAATSSSSQSLECVKLLLEKEKISINWQDYNGRSALHLAVVTGTTEVTRFLAVRNECNIDCLDNNFCTSLHWAAAKDFPDKVDILLNGRASCTSADGNGANPLHYAAYNNHARTVQVFLSRNYVCGDAVDGEGRNALIWAAATNAVDVVDTLATNEADLLFADKEGLTALHAAALRGHVPAVETLLRHGVPTDVKDVRGRTPLMRACEYGRSRTAHALSEAGADVFARDAHGRSALHWCALGGHAYLCQMVLHKGVKSDVQDAFGMTPLHYACTGSGYLSCVSILLEAGASPNLCDKEGQSPLDWAVLTGNSGVVRLLCEYGADVNLISFKNSWTTALDVADAEGSSEIVQLLRLHGALKLLEIEEIAATKIQAWFRSLKTACQRIVVQKADIKSPPPPSERGDLLSICQQISDAFDFSTSDHGGKYRLHPRWSAHCTAATAEWRAAAVVQRAWRRHSLKSKFRRLRRTVAESFPTEQSRRDAEKQWLMKLQAFHEQM